MSQLNLNASNKIHLRIDKFICLNPPAAGKTKKKEKQNVVEDRPVAAYTKPVAIKKKRIL